MSGRGACLKDEAGARRIAVVPLGCRHAGARDALGLECVREILDREERCVVILVVSTTAHRDVVAGHRHLAAAVLDNGHRKIAYGSRRMGHRADRLVGRIQRRFVHGAGTERLA